MKERKQRNQEQEIVDAIGVMGAPHPNCAQGPHRFYLILAV